MPWWPWLKRLHREEELDRELRAHLDLEAEDQQEAGMTPEEARYAAQRALGNTGLIKEATRVMWGWTSVDHLQQDLRYAGRMMRKSPGFTVVAVASLALGIGANTAIFSLINAVLIRPLAGVAEPERLVRLTNGSYSYPKLEALRAQGIFAQTVGFDLTRFTAEVNGTTQKIQTVLASGDYYAALGVRPMLGRVLTPEDDRTRAPVAVLSHEFWTRMFSADESVLGKSLRVNGLTVMIVGVTPPDFRGIVVGWVPDVTLPVTAAAKLWAGPRSDALNQRSAHWLDIIAKLAPGQSQEQANARLQAVWPQILVDTAPDNTRLDSAYFRHRTELQPAATGFPGPLGTYASPLYVLMGLVGLVLLIACANVANLLLARGSARQREFAVRLATGAGRGRLIRQLMTENILLALIATLAGALLASWGTRLLVSFISSSRSPVFLDLTPDWRVLV